MTITDDGIYEIILLFEIDFRGRWLEGLDESRMWEIHMSGLTRGGWKQANERTAPVAYSTIIIDIKLIELILG
jgi:hypothetical protein